MLLAVGALSCTVFLIARLLAQEAVPALKCCKWSRQRGKHQEVKRPFQGYPGGHWPSPNWSSAQVQKAQSCLPSAAKQHLADPPCVTGCIPVARQLNAGQQPAQQKGKNAGFGWMAL